jgi:hypothetical protein
MKWLAILLMLCSVANADDLARADEPHLAVSGTIGVVTPLGFGGVEVEAQLARWLGASAGIGLAASGPQVAVMVRGGVAVTDLNTLYLGAGVSGGRYHWNDFLWKSRPLFSPATDKTWERAYWANGEIGLHRQSNTPWSVRFFVGIGRLLNRDAYTCTGGNCMTDDLEWLPYGGVAAARAITF